MPEGRRSQTLWRQLAGEETVRYRLPKMAPLAACRCRAAADGDGAARRAGSLPTASVRRQRGEALVQAEAAAGLYNETVFLSWVRRFLFYLRVFLTCMYDPMLTLH